MIKLVVSDMDGTLLNDEKEFPIEFFDVYKKMKEKGVMFSVASGRQYFNLLEIFKNIKDDVIFISENGAKITYKDKDLFTSFIDPEYVNKFIDALRKAPGVLTILCGNKGAYIEGENYELFWDRLKQHYSIIKKVDDLKEVDDDILQITVCDLGKESHSSLKYLKDLNDYFKIVTSGEIWIDITNKGVNKGLAIEKIEEIFGLKYEEIMTFGDYLNDIEMTKKAKYSFAMENAHPELKKVSNYTAKSNNENGVLEKIKEFIIDEKK